MSITFTCAIIPEGLAVSKLLVMNLLEWVKVPDTSINNSVFHLIEKLGNAFYSDSVSSQPCSRRKFWLSTIQCNNSTLVLVNWLLQSLRSFENSSWKSVKSRIYQYGPFKMDKFSVWNFIILVNVNVLSGVSNSSQSRVFKWLMYSKTSSGIGDWVFGVQLEHLGEIVFISSSSAR